MAFENGDNVYDYCQPVFEKYKKDQLIFVKAMQTVEVFKNRSDFPFCIDELNEAVKHILGEGIDDFAFWINKYVIILEEHMKWEPREALNIFGDDFDPDNPEDETIDLLSEYKKEEGDRIAANFENDIKSFCLTMRPIFDKLLSSGKNPMGIRKVMAEDSSDDGKKNIRIIRNDDIFLDIQLSKNEVSSLIGAFKKLKKEFG